MCYVELASCKTKTCPQICIHLFRTRLRCSFCQLYSMATIVAHERISGHYYISYNKFLVKIIFTHFWYFVQLVAADLLNFMQSNCTFNPLLLHGFSVGGYLWGEVCLIASKDRQKYLHSFFTNFYYYWFGRKK